jgi:tRNA uridine 5-carboxymethylaminomethyl modification enzyme
MPKASPIIVVGAGHAGCEAALASARLGRPTLLLTIRGDTIAKMSCNPAIGGLAKGQLVREIDALGGEMARAIDRTGLQFRRLNTKKGPAVRSRRAQADLEAYRRYMTEVVTRQPNLTVREALVDAVLADPAEAGRVQGVRLSTGETLTAAAVVVTTGTFLRGLIHVGLDHHPAGRFGEPPAENLSRSLAALGLELGRLKTGTCPRLDARTLDCSRLQPQAGDEPPLPFSFDAEFSAGGPAAIRNKIVCYITYTNERTHELIRAGLARSPLFTGVIRGVGPRYCPSIEDKVRRFPDRVRHQIFLEPVGLDTVEVYPNGISTSLPYDVQEQFVHSIAGLERAAILRPGYAIEYDFVKPTQLLPSLMTRAVAGLFLAGQINGSSGYEEAAAQGIMAGINAAHFSQELEPLILDRSQAYIGVLIDDLTTRGTEEPYRMFTSRAEYRLLLREDNADLRLSEIGHRLGLLPEARFQRFLAKKEAIEKTLGRLETPVPPSPEVNARLQALGSARLPAPTSLRALLRRPEVQFSHLLGLEPELEGLAPEVAEEVEIMIKYEGYLAREQAEVARFRELEAQRIPEQLNYAEVKSLSREVREKLEKVRPRSLGQASRIPGMTPAALAVLQVRLKKAAPRGRDQHG